MNQLVQIQCRNTRQTLSVPMGCTLLQVFTQMGLHMPYGPLVALVNNKVQDLNYRLYNQKVIEFLDIHHPLGMRSYVRTLCMVLVKATEECLPQAKLYISVPVTGGIFCELHMDRPSTPEDIQNIRQRMEEIVHLDLPISRIQCSTEQASTLFSQRGMESKVQLLKTVDRLYYECYQLEQTIDDLYTPLLVRTGQLHLFDIIPFYQGMLLRVPCSHVPSQLEAITEQTQLMNVVREYHHWQDILGVRTVGDFNSVVQKGRATDLINVSEALQDRKLNRIADEIVQRRARLVLLAGPSSSGKTTTSKRLAILLMACGLHPHTISIDNYFVNREDTPRDEKGEYDFECIQAVDIPFFNKQMNALLQGEQVELPRYDFPSGHRVFEGNTLQIGSDHVLILEGNHALNPLLTQQIPDEQKYRIFVSAITNIQLDDHNCIHSRDIRLLRRIVRDYRYRGYSAQQTIRRCPSVSRGEEKWITPYQGYADVVFNSALLYEIFAIKEQALAILEQVSQREVEYAEASRLKHFLRYFCAIPSDQVPPTSLLREFAGGSSFKY